MEKGGEAGGGRPEYSIIVPTYNERLNIALIVYLIFKHPPDAKFEIIIVDDGSPDGTQDIVKQLQQVYGEDRVLLRARPRKLGLGELSCPFLPMVIVMLDVCVNELL
ncbi:unnamed protein product [Triticum turgidum subsp. durum]|uniref:dolichyl-phosphate beta-D-mannosyltransferase n=1 Tax=Triticum turgidum subsp. durum TaxID=4567 RepID=A0A9R0XLW9_TRITD|nr:unnamed protein product [Triticum turgidum subsp. durum]